MSTNQPENTDISGDDGTKQTYEVEVMLSVKQLIETMPDSRQTPEYLDILNRVKKYLHKHCSHNVVHDLIDIDPDRNILLHNLRKYFIDTLGLYI
jgi:hypothetical protein